MNAAQGTLVASCRFVEALVSAKASGFQSRYAPATSQSPAAASTVTQADVQFSSKHIEAGLPLLIAFVQSDDALHWSWQVVSLSPQAQKQSKYELHADAKVDNWLEHFDCTQE